MINLFTAIFEKIRAYNSFLCLYIQILGEKHNVISMLVCKTSVSITAFFSEMYLLYTLQSYLTDMTRSLSCQNLKELHAII